MQACIELPNGRLYCYLVPVVRLPRVPIDMPNGSSDPNPWPWLSGPGMTLELQADLSLLAGIEHLVDRVHASGLRDKLRAALPLAELARGLDLPEGMSVHAGRPGCTDGEEARA